MLQTGNTTIWNMQHHSLPDTRSSPETQCLPETDPSARGDVHAQDFGRAAVGSSSHSLIVRPITENDRVAYTAA